MKNEEEYKEAIEWVKNSGRIIIINIVVWVSRAIKFSKKWIVAEILFCIFISFVIGAISEGSHNVRHAKPYISMAIIALIFFVSYLAKRLKNKGE
ncbi:MAG: hypothetical protein LBP54_06325 [Campylobacteraceae bacterium]|jgi:hypothetical protein|nr:hypothetical protein [Campylobacteraceae bacterium]